MVIYNEIYTIARYIGVHGTYFTVGIMNLVVFKWRVKCVIERVAFRPVI